MSDTSTILAGGRQLPITLIDGTTTPIKVRQLPIRQLTEYDAKQGDEPALVELYCDKEKGWADTLTHESYEAIVALGDEINRGPFERFRDRLAERLGMVKESRQVMVDAGLLPDPKPQRPKPGELLVMPEVKPAAGAPAAAVTPAAAAAESPSMTSLENSSSPESSQPESEH